MKDSESCKALWELKVCKVVFFMKGSYNGPKYIN